MYLKIKLLSDTAFGRGDGVAGVVDNEVEHDNETGLPIVKGRTIKGLMAEACADILFSLKHSGSPSHDEFESIARNLFGQPGSDLDSGGLLHFGTATLPHAFVQKVKASNYQREQILEAFTTIRHQTAVDPEFDRPMDETLRATRVLLRDTIFHAPLSASVTLNADEIALLVACASTVRNVGLSRNRGLGHVEVTLEASGENNPLSHFEKLVREEVKWL